MERILVFSDSHFNNKYMLSVINKIPNITHIIHLGDMLKDIKSVIDKYPLYQYKYVVGNNEFSKENSEETFNVGNSRFFITHGHKYGVKSGYDRVIYKALSKNCNVCLFGHTHIPYLKKEEDILILNPGSIGQPFNNKPSYGIIEIEDNKISADIIYEQLL